MTKQAVFSKYTASSHTVDTHALAAPFMIVFIHTEILTLLSWLIHDGEVNIFLFSIHSAWLLHNIVFFDTGTHTHACMNNQ